MFTMAIVVQIGLEKGMKMFWFKNPDLLTVESRLAEEDKVKLPIGDVSTHWIEIMKGEGQFPLATVDLDRDSRKYMIIRLINVMNSKTKDMRSGEMLSWVKPTSPMERCQSKNFKS